MLPRIEYSVSVPVSIDSAFQAFQNLERLRHSGIYDDIAWVEGAPWQVGSRVRYIIKKPIPVTVSVVVSAIAAPRAISLISHGLGVTGEENVFFGADPKGGTRVRATIDLVGEPELPESAMQSKLTFLLKDMLDSMAQLCEHSASSANG